MGAQISHRQEKSVAPVGQQSGRPEGASSPRRHSREGVARLERMAVSLLLPHAIALQQLQQQPMLHFSSVDGSLLANGKPFRVKGVTWWGAESARALPGGLEHRSLDEVLGLLARYGFNAIKLPFLHQHVLFDETVPAASFDPAKSPQLLEYGRPRKYVASLREVARRAAAHGITVWLVAHSLEGLWYSRAISEATVLESWTSLARQLCPQWNVAGVDLKNRPWAASWGHAKPIDWDRAASRIGCVHPQTDSNPHTPA